MKEEHQMLKTETIAILKVGDVENDLIRAPVPDVH